jgi:hypothetical protein
MGVSAERQPAFMNLFSSTRTSSADPVQAAIRNAAATTGAGFDYLLSTARRESGLDPSARAGTSSATGLFQFIDSTWLETVKEAGPALGFGDYASAIAKTPSGTYVAPDPAARAAILALREDPEANALMAGALTQRNREKLIDALGREPTEGELYAAHFMGAQGAASLIGLAASAGDTNAAAAFPRHAAANPAIFYDADGRARSIGEVYEVVTSGAARANAAAAGEEEALPQNPAAWLAIPAHNAYAAEGGMAFHGLFRSNAGAPLSHAVSTHWSRLGPQASEANRSVSPSIGPAPQAAESAGAGKPLVAPPPQQPQREGVLSTIGSFFASIFAVSQAAPVRDGKAWGG